jgi:Putative outer membrane beta-barrel porin, MtrB/PioB
MNMLCRKKLAALIALALVSHVVYAEPPPVQSQESATTQEGGASIDPMENQLDAEAQSAKLQGYITPKFIYFNYTDGVGQNSTHFMERYNYLEPSHGSNRRDGLIADVDLSLAYSGEDRDYLLLEREGYGKNNQRTRLKLDGDFVKFNVYHSIYESATGGIDYRFNPNAVVGGTDQNYSAAAGNAGESQHVSQFNFDSPDTLYHVSRNNTGASILFKPVLFDANGTVEVSFDSIARKGNKMTNYILPSAALSGGSGSTSSELAQWRGYSQPIDEHSKRFAVNLALTPRDMFQLNYELSVDAFQSNTTPTTIATISQLSGIPIGSGGSVPFFNTTVAAGQPDVPLNFVADSTLISNSLRLGKQFSDSALLSAGLSTAGLKQNSFTSVQQTAGYNDGKIGTDSAYLTGRFNIAESISLEAFLRYNKRQNDSSYPVAGFYDPVSTTSYVRMVMPRINRIETKTYGLEAHLYPSILKTSWTAGWSHEDKDRDLTYGTDSVLAPQLMLYQERSRSDEVYLKLVSRPAKRWTIRLTPSYLWSDQTGLVTEPEEAVQLKTLVSYSRPEWNELLASAYYNYKEKKNGLLGYSNYDQYTGFSAPQAQKVSSTLQSAGLNLSLVPRETVKVNLGYAWTQMDFDAYYFSTNRVRFHYLNVTGGGTAPPPAGYTLWPLDFLLLSQPNFRVDSHTLSAGVEWQAGTVSLSGIYSLSWSKGHNASGLTEPLPDADNSVDNQLHSLSLGLDYPWKDTLSLRLSYTYDYYKDNVYEELSGALHTLMLGLSFQL